MIKDLNDVDDTHVKTLCVLDVLNRYRAKGIYSPSIKSVLKEAFGKISNGATSATTETTYRTGRRMKVYPSSTK